MMCKSAYGCSCRYYGGFAYSSQLVSTVVYGQVIEYDSIGTYNMPQNPYSIKFLIKEKIRGHEIIDTITIWGDNGMLCRPYINHFKPKTEWILALFKIKSNNGNAGYSLSSCGENYVPVENGKVSGRIYAWNPDTRIKKYDYETVRKSILNPWNHLLIRTPKKTIGEKLGLYNYKEYDQLPQNSLSFQEINTIINQQIQIPDLYYKNGGDLLIHIPILVDSLGELHFNEEAYVLKNFEKISQFKLQIFEVLKEIGSWKPGFKKKIPVDVAFTIPILLLN